MILTPSLALAAAALLCVGAAMRTASLAVASWTGDGRVSTDDRPHTASLLVELAVVTALAATYVAHPAEPVLVLLLPVVWSAVVATPIDLAKRIIPNRITYPLAVWSLLAATGLGVVTGDWATWRRAMIVGLAMPTVMLVLSLLFELVRGNPGMGMGDIKWALSLGVAFGWLGAGYVILFLYATIASSLVVLVAMLATGRAEAASRLPYGPYLAFATVLVATAGHPIGLALFG